MIESIKEKQVVIYSHGNIQTDLSIHIEHENRAVSYSGSDLGIQLTSNLKNFGMVNHHIWVQMSQ